MTNEKSEWWRDPKIIFPIIIIVIMIVGIFVQPFVSQKLSEKDKELSYSIEDSEKLLDPQVTRGLEIKINDTPTSYLVAYRVRIWNSGDMPLKNLPIRFVFNSPEGDFKILRVRHDTKPKYEFGEIKEEDIDAYSKRFIYPLSNPKNEDIVTFLTNYPASLSVYAKSEGLSVKEVKPP